MENPLTEPGRRYYCRYYKIDCGEELCWIFRAEGKIRPCPHKGDIKTCFEQAAKKINT